MSSPAFPATPPALSADVRLLDGEQVLAILAGYLETPLGQDRLAALRLVRDRERLQRGHARLAEAIAWLERSGAPAFALPADPRPLLRQAQLEGMALEAKEILVLLTFAERCAELRQRLASGGAAAAGSAETASPLLAALAGRFPDLADLLDGLRGRILPNGELADGASPELRRLRQEIERQRRAIEVSLETHLRRLGADGILQENLITLRGERFVLPVKVELRRRVPGVLHGASSSGQTVYIEPLETVDLNNDLVRALDAEQAEQRRILREMTGLIGARAGALLAAAETAGKLEFEFAKARFARDFQAGPVTFAESGGEQMELLQARHPLLVATSRARRQAVVPLDFVIREERLVVISGPNAGGKTVALKTVGIAAWMAQCLLPVCAASACLPIFDRLLADVGDAQSMSESLSTFSSHVLRLRTIIETAGAESLVLLDELGSATNPAEGAALATAILEALSRNGCRALVSTHHDALKAWATARAGAANASVGFDPETLQPTYQFRLGVPGVSAGLEMARRLGLQAGIVDAAQAALSGEQRLLTDFLQRLESELERIGMERRQIAEREIEINRRTLALENEQRDAHQRKLADLERRFQRLGDEMERRLRQAIEALGQNAARKIEKESALQAARLRREASDAFRAELAPTSAAPAAGLALESLQPGDRLRLRGMSAPGRLLRRDGARLEVEVGHLRLRVGIEEVEARLEPLEKAPSASGVRLTTAVVDSGSVREINLIGQSADEARTQLEKFLDRALLAELPRVRIVHGFGQGVLRRAIAEMLRAHPEVERFYHPPHAEGGEGVTIAEMKV